MCAQSCPILCSPINCSHQAPLPMEFSRQVYWSGLPFPSPRHLPNTEIKLLTLKSNLSFADSWEGIKKWKKSNRAHGDKPLSLEGSQSPGTMRHKERGHGKHLTPPLRWTEHKGRGRKWSPWLPAVSRHSRLSQLCLWGFCLVSLCTTGLTGPLFLPPLTEPIQPDYSAFRGTSEVWGSWPLRTQCSTSSPTPPSLEVWVCPRHGCTPCSQKSASPSFQ